LATSHAQSPVPFHEPFAGNSIVLSRVGGADIATGNLTPASFAVALDEFRIASGAGAFATVSYAQTMYIPADGPSQHTSIGNSKVELQLSRTTIGGQNAILFAGYDAPTGVSGLASSQSFDRPRVITSVTQSGVIDPTTRITDAPSASITSAVSFDGASVHFASDGANGRIRSAFLGATTSSAMGTVSQINRLATHNGGLYASGSTSNNTIYSIDLGTGAAVPLPGLSGVPNSQMYDFFFAGDTTLYVAQDGGGATGIGGLVRYDFDGAAWAFNYAIAIEPHPDAGSGGTLAGLVGLSAQVDLQLGRVDVYATSAEGRNTRLIGVTDFLSNTLGTQASVATLYTNPFSDVAASRSSAWRGVAHFPVPAPSTAALLTLSTLAAIRRRR
jgi:hypothetical protein